MTVLTFPTNPINGQRYSAPNGIQYVYYCTVSFS
jgi:hypothetical protein